TDRLCRGDSHRKRMIARALALKLTDLVEDSLAYFLPKCVLFTITVHYLLIFPVLFSWWFRKFRRHWSEAELQSGTRVRARGRNSVGASSEGVACTAGISDGARIRPCTRHRRKALFPLGARRGRAERGDAQQDG